MSEILRQKPAIRPSLWRASSLIGVLVLGAGLTACSDVGHEQAPVYPQVQVMQAEAVTVPRYLYETGTTQAVNRVDLVARVSGLLQSIDYRDGARVKAGDRLFLIEPDQYRAQLEQAQATVMQARATLDNAERQLDRQNQLSRSSVTSDLNVDNARASRDTAAAQLASAEASLKMAQLNLDYTSVEAPFDGVVTAHQVDVGALVGGNSATGLATIIQLDPLQVSFSVSDGEMLRIRQQARAQGRALDDLSGIVVELGTQIDSGFPYKARLDYASPETSAETGTLSARAVLDNPENALLPGLFVRMRIPLGKVGNVRLLPPSAIGTDQQGRYVLVVNAENILERRSVTPLDRSGALQQVTGELGETDQIVINIASAPRAGATVDKRIADAAPNPQPEQSGATSPDRK